jgi:tetratricopeptide (TPR) repeat protein
MSRLLLLVALLLVSASAGAQPDGAGAEAAHKKALAHYERGEYAAAAAAFKAAYLAQPGPELLYAIGQALRQAGQCSEALEYYRQYLRTQPGPKQVISTRENMKRCSTAPPSSLPATRPAPRRLAMPEGAPPPPPGRRAWYRDWVGGTLLGAGLVATGAGAAVFAVGRGRVEEVNTAADYGSFDRHYSSGQSGEVQQRVGVAVLVTGAALVTAGIVRYLLVRRSAARTER